MSPTRWASRAGPSTSTCYLAASPRTGYYVFGLIPVKIPVRESISRGCSRLLYGQVDRSLEQNPAQLAFTLDPQPRFCLHSTNHLTPKPLRNKPPSSTPSTPGDFNSLLAHNKSDTLSQLHSSSSRDKPPITTPRETFTSPCHLHLISSYPNLVLKC